MRTTYEVFSINCRWFKRRVLLANVALIETNLVQVLVAFFSGYETISNTRDQSKIVEEKGIAYMAMTGNVRIYPRTGPRGLTLDVTLSSRIHYNPVMRPPLHVQQRSN